MDVIQKIHTRVCPKCNKIISHKTKKSCDSSKNKGRMCQQCCQRGRKKKKISCPYCNLKITNFDLFYDHLKIEHKKDPKKAYVESFLNGIIPTCECGCGQETVFKSWSKGFRRFIIYHNGNIYNIYDEKEIEKILEKRLSSWTKTNGRKSWSKGKTKENDLRLKNLSNEHKRKFKSGKIIQWNKGLTKETDERIKKHSKIISDSLKKRFEEEGCFQWSKGLTKKTDERIASYNYKKLSHEEILKKISKTRFTLLSDYSEYDNHESLLAYKCSICNNASTMHLIQACNDRCFFCDPKGSQAQLEIRDFISSLGFNTINSTRHVISPYEIDIWIPEKKFGVEYNGLYYHSEASHSIDPKYHSRKISLAEEKGIHLIHIFEDEWQNKKSIIESIIKNCLGATPKKIPARKCNVVDLSPAARKDFFEKHHLDGDVRSHRAWGLMIDDEIVAALSVRRPHHKKYSNLLEVSRFCSKIETLVQGGLSKLIKVAWEEVKRMDKEGLLTYVDTRFGTGDSYEKVGFKFVSLTSERFWWTDLVHRHDRFSFRAKDGKSQKEIALEAKVYRIWGCRNKIYIMCV